MSTALLTEPEVIRVAAREVPAHRSSVSVVIPCYNEEQFIGMALANLAHQYACGNYEIVVVDGMSTDRTRGVVEEFAKAHPEISVRVLNNPQRNIPHALNLGIAAAGGEIIARMDAHAAPSRNYIERCVEILENDPNALVGMPCRVMPGTSTTTARAIAIAVSHPFGVGDASYRLPHTNTEQQEVDTVAFACFRKSVWSELGGFDEKLLTNEDYDFNYRARNSGRRVLLDRQGHCDYFARPTLAKLAAQYLRYGAWKARMLRVRPRSLKLRQLIAPLFVASLVVLAIAGFFRPIFWLLQLSEALLYLVTNLFFASSAVVRRQQNYSLVPALVLAFFTIHLSWGASFFWGLVTPANKTNK
jgi:succinoglycan biosynthesis protein ExoA